MGQVCAVHGTLRLAPRASSNVMYFQSKCGSTWIDVDQKRLHGAYTGDVK